MTEEQWRVILEFPDYQISSLGRVYNDRLGIMMSTSLNNHGHTKISLRKGRLRHTRSVAQLVGEAFVMPPNELCDHIVALDGDNSNATSENLVWRPRWFMWKYAHQLKVRQPIYYHNLAVVNLNTGDEYESIIAAGMTEGLLFDDIWRSTYRREPIFPYGYVFEVIERVYART